MFSCPICHDSDFTHDNNPSSLQKLTSKCKCLFCEINFYDYGSSFHIMLSMEYWKIGSRKDRAFISCRSRKGELKIMFKNFGENQIKMGEKLDSVFFDEFVKQAMVNSVLNS